MRPIVPQNRLLVRMRIWYSMRAKGNPQRRFMITLEIRLCGPKPFRLVLHRHRFSSQCQICLLAHHKPLRAHWRTLTPPLTPNLVRTCTLQMRTLSTLHSFNSLRRCIRTISIRIHYRLQEGFHRIQRMLCPPPDQHNYLRIDPHCHQSPRRSQIRRTLPRH
eukprot:Rmarinus@m.29962